MSTDYPDLQEATIRQLQDGMTAGHFTSLDLVKAYISRISEVNPLLHAVISISPAAFQAARLLDEERQQGKVRSVLHGIPFAVKDNIATRMEDGMDTTAGSFSLQGARVPGDADCVARLREAGAVILCKTNLAEWANFRGVGTASWSPVGGHSTSPYYPQGDPSGSSCGSGIAAAVGLAAFTLGTETGGSMMFPSSYCAGVAIRSTLGLVPSTGVVPITPLRDNVGPMTRTVEDACLVLEVLSNRKGCYVDSLDRRDLAGVRLLAPTNLTNWEGNALLHYGQKQALEKAYQVLRNLGAEVIEAPVSDKFVQVDRDDSIFLETVEMEFVAEIKNYLASMEHIPSGIRDLEDIVQYTSGDPRESPLHYDSFRQFESSLRHGSVDPSDYINLRAKVDQAKDLVRFELHKHSAQAIISLAATTRMWSHAAWPMITVPLGLLGDDVPVIKRKVRDKRGEHHEAGILSMHPNKPFGIAFGGESFAEDKLIRVAHAFEQATGHRRGCTTYPEATPKTQLKDVM